MDWERLKRQLEQILQTEIRQVHVGKAEWARLGEAGNLPVTASREREGEILFPVLVDGDRVEAAAVSAAQLTDTERRLVEVTLETLRLSDPLPKRKNGQDALPDVVREWVEGQIAS